MILATQVSLEEYLQTAYRPDCDYVDGEVLERNLGDSDHSDIQAELVVYFRNRRKEWNVWAGPELRIIVGPKRVRIPDVTVILGNKPTERFLTQAPFLCIEVLSERDTLHNIQDRVDDYVQMGVPNIWVIDPTYRSAWISHNGALEPVRDGVLRTSNPDIALPLAELFAS